jgi:hypothetical protein
MNMNQEKEISLITKEAAGMKTWMREKLLPSGWTRGIGEGLIGDYKEKMEVLRYVDDRIYEWMDDIDDRYKAMQAALKGNRLVDLALLLADFNGKLKQVNSAGKEIEQLSQEALTEFDIGDENTYANQFTPEQMEQAFKADDGIISEAGYISDLKRKWVAKKLQDKARKDRSLALNRFLANLKVLIGRVKISLDKMSQFRASGDIGKYTDQLRVIEKEQKNFESQFFPIYKTYLKPLVDRVIAQEKARNKENDELLAEHEAANQEQEEPQRTTIPGEPVREALTSGPPPLPPEIPNLEQEDIDQSLFENSAETVMEEPKKTKIKKEKAPKSIPPLSVPKEESPKLDRRVIRSPADLKVEPEEPQKPAQPKPSRKKKIQPSQEPAQQPTPETQPQITPASEQKPEEPKKESSLIEIAIQKKANANFIHELAKASSADDPMLIVRMILKYAGDIEDSQPENSVALTELAAQILQ